MVNQAFINKAKELGFIAVGFSKPREPIFFDFFLQWVKEVEVGNMSYLKRNIDLRKDPTTLLDGLQTIISLAYPYPAGKPSTPDGYTTSRYSTPQQEDYHFRLRNLARQLCTFITESFPESRNRICIDSAPVLERDFAVMSGIGFIGKNNMLIVPGFGSYCFLVDILTTAAFPVTSLKMPENVCGSCTRCIESCPTGALRAPFYMQASKCLSYLTIESKDDIDRDVTNKMGNTFFGCDVCQEVCPFNKNSCPVVLLPATQTILEMTEFEFKRTFGNTVFKRTGLNKIKRTISSLKEKTPQLIHV
ncbi:MAG TPA: tRNA epoxyqueuosine(34) reductase QueG [Desulfatiglandales bacterium]|nr:tRNA epoxyqueuosine(34) reductase QueG [Desulfatiglandales bacterium]